MDEGFMINFDKNYENLKSNLQDEVDYIIVEIEFCIENTRKLILDKLNEDLPGIEIVWKCFENNIEKANKNVINRKNKGDPEGHIRINNNMSTIYTFPQNAEVLPIITDWN